jgi:hypothetical protein
LFWDASLWKLVEMTFVCWKSPKNQAFQALGWLMVNASQETFSNAWLDHSPEQHSIAEVIVMSVLGRLASKLAKIAFVFWNPRKPSIPGFGMVDGPCFQ